MSLVLSRGVDGKGVLSFDAAVSLTLPGPALRPTALGVADLDADARPDLVIAEDAAPVVRVYLNTSQKAVPSRSACRRATSPPPSPSPACWATSTSTATWTSPPPPQRPLGDRAPRRRQGAFGKAVHYEVGIGPVALAAGEIHGDKRPDLVTANRAAGTITVLLSR